MQIYLKNVNFARRFEGSSSHLPLFAITCEGGVEGYNNNDDDDNTGSGGQRGWEKCDSTIEVFVTQG